MGELSDVGVADLLYLLGLRRHTGKLTITANGEEVQLYLDDGAPVLVTSSNLALRLGRTLLRLGLLTADQLQEALQEQEVVGHGRPLGSILIARDWITPDDLGRCVEEQCIEALARVVAAENGSFLFTGGVATPPRAEIIQLNADRILMEAMRRTDELATMRGLLPASSAPLTLGPAIDQVADQLSDSEVLVAATLVSGASSLGELADQVAMDQLALWRTVISMRERGLLVAGEPPEPEPFVVQLLKQDDEWNPLKPPGEASTDEPDQA